MIDRITVRMYEVGFGDCLLLTLRSEGSDKRILFDCGSLNRPKADVKKVAADVIAACTPPGGRPRLELVVCTHRHKDHVWGFDDPAWGDVEVGEVWMPWTEDPGDPRAARIRERQSAFAAALCQAFAPEVTEDAAPLDGRRARKDRAKIALAMNALTNERAMATLHGGFLGRPPRRFLPVANEAVQVLELATIPGVRFHILGPSRDEGVIKDMDPPAGKAYLAGIAAGEPGGEREGAFRSGWRIPEAEFRTMLPDTTFDEGDRKALHALANQPDGELAAALDSAVNNTSLMMMVEAGNQYLLFPGDAQWGTWNTALE